MPDNSAPQAGTTAPPTPSRPTEYCVTCGHRRGVHGLEAGCFDGMGSAIKERCYCAGFASDIPPAASPPVAPASEPLDHFIWSYEYGLWWKADRQGYTTESKYAGRYTKLEAEKIAASDLRRAGSTRKGPSEEAVPIATIASHRWKSKPFPSESQVSNSPSPPVAGTRKFRKKPVVIEAEQFTQAMIDLKVPNAEGVCWNPSHMHEPHVHTIHAGRMVAVVPGDWIIPEPDGEHFYPCKPDIFEATYEPA